MTITLSQQWIDKLVRLPESGMGYQVVDVRLRDGRILTGVLVQNAELLSLPEGVVFVNEDIADISLHRKQR